MWLFSRQNATILGYFPTYYYSLGAIFLLILAFLAILWRENLAALFGCRIEQDTQGK